MIDLVVTRRVTDWLRRTMAIAIVLGVLLFPATCSHAAGPHSLFIDPREAATSGGHDHAHHTVSTGDHQAAGRPANHGSAGLAGEPANALTWTDLPSTMGMSLAASAILMSIPQVMAIPTAQMPASGRGAQLLRGIPVPVDVPPPRAGV